MPTPAPTGHVATRVGGRYRLEGLVGRGGSAEVWRAEDEALGRQVAVKLVTTPGGDDAGRVADEARLLARLSNPGLVPVYDAGTDDDGRPWVVMELVEGETLADAVRRGPLDPYRVAETGRVLAEALAYVHGRGLVHRDVKPANVLLGVDGRVRLTDFGIARLVDAAHVTATGLTVGTASYLSPEQVTGAHVGPPSDVYSLGLVLLECLKGQREYPGTAVEVALARLNRPPQVPAHLPYGWPGLLQAMTALEPGRRPTASQVQSELRAVLAGGEATTVLTTAPLVDADRTTVIDRTALAAPVGVPAAPRPPVVPARPDPPPQRSSGWAWVWLLAALVAVAAVAALFVQQQRNDPGPDPVPPSGSLPQELRDSLDRLQEAVPG